MTISHQTAVASALATPISERIPAGIMAYFSARTRGTMFEFIHQKLSEAEGEGLTRKELANRIGKSPTRLSHILGSPGNWTIDTVSELLIGIAGEEIVPQSRKVVGRPNRNFNSEAEIIRDDGKLSQSPTDSATVKKLEMTAV